MKRKRYYQVSRRGSSRRKRMISFRAAVIVLACLIVGGGVYLGVTLFGNREVPASSSSAAPDPGSPADPSSPGEDSSSSVGADGASSQDSLPSASGSHSSDMSVFDNAAFLGNSLVDDLNTYNILPNTDFFAKTGLTVTSVMTQSTVKGTVPVIDELTKKQYEKVFILFGLNELGWEYPSVFEEDYGKLIDEVRLRQPDAEIYVQSLLPVSAAASEKNKNNVNNPRIQQYNELLKTVAREKGVVYLDTPDALQDSDGNLPDKASADGVHPNPTYCKYWMESIRDTITSND